MGGAFYIGGAILYAKRIPEKFYPGTFDIVGSSHQIFHMCVIIGAYIHMVESLNLFQGRQAMVCPIEVPDFP